MSSDGAKVKKLPAHAIRIQSKEVLILGKSICKTNDSNSIAMENSERTNGGNDPCSLASEELRLPWKQWGAYRNR